MTENEKIIKDIIEKNSKLYGEIQKCCLMYKNYCKCDKSEIRLDTNK